MYRCIRPWLFTAYWVATLGAWGRDEDYVETSAFAKTVSVVFSGSSAMVSNPADSGVTFAQNGAVLAFTNSARQVAFALSGTSSAGSVKIYSDKPFKLTLDGISLTSPDGPAVNVQTKRMCYVVLPPGTTNVLTDAATYSTQYDATNGIEDAKGVIFSEGQLLFSGTGILLVQGVCAEKHGVCSDDYVRILDGDIRIAMAQRKSDGVHAKDRFQMDGGRLTVALAQKGDGIDADDDGRIEILGGQILVNLATNDSRGIKCGTNVFNVAGGAVRVVSTAGACNALSGDGALTVSGGVLDLSLAGTNCNAIKCGGVTTVSGGDLSVAIGGAGSKGLNADGDAVFNGGTLCIHVDGDAVLERATNSSSFVYTDPSYAIGIKADNVLVNAGTLSLVVSGAAGRGISADNDLTASGGTVSIASTGGTTATFTNKDNVVDVSATACMRAGRALAIRGGTFTFSVAGTAGKGFSAASSAVFDGGLIDLDLSGSATLVNHGTYKDPAYCAGIACDGAATISNGSFRIYHTGVAGRGFMVGSNMTIAGGTFEITTTGTNTALYTNSSSVADVGSASAFKTDGNLAITGGTFDLLATGACGKGIHVDGALTIGTGGVTGTPVIVARTTGKQVKVSGTTGGSRPAPPDANDDYSNPKAIEAAGNIVVQEGSITVATSNSGGEGLESKGILTINGGSIEATCYDDCLNARTNITINGGQVYCSASNNDGIDSNGTLTLNGGVIASFGTVAPEEGLDCDQNTFTMNGGVFVGCGGATSYPNAGSQYALIYTGSLTSNAVLRITNTGGTSIFAFRMPRTYSGSVKLLCGCPSIASSGTYTVYTGATMTGSHFHGLYTNNVSSASGGTSSGSDSTPTSRYYAVP